MTGVLVLDTGALIGIERRSHRVRSIVEGAKARQIGLIIPTVVVAQAVRGGPRQANLHRFLSDSYLRFSGFDYETSWEVGRLLGDSGGHDVVDAAVVVCAREYGRCPVVTSDPEDIRKLDQELAIIRV